MCKRHLVVIGRGVENTLDQYANEQKLPRDYTEQFFLSLPRASQARDPEDQPKTPPAPQPPSPPRAEQAPKAPEAQA